MDPFLLLFDTEPTDMPQKSDNMQQQQQGRCNKNKPRHFSIVDDPEFWEVWFVTALESLDSCPPPPLTEHDDEKTEPYDLQHTAEWWADRFDNGNGNDPSRMISQHPWSTRQRLSLKPHLQQQQQQQQHPQQAQGPSPDELGWKHHNNRTLEDREHGNSRPPRAFALWNKNQTKDSFRGDKDTAQQTPIRNQAASRPHRRYPPVFANLLLPYNASPPLTTNTTNTSETGMKETLSVSTTNTTETGMKETRSVTAPLDLRLSPPQEMCPLLGDETLPQPPLVFLGNLRVLSMMVYPLLLLVVLFFCDLIRTRNRIRSLEQRMHRDMERHETVWKQQQQQQQQPPAVDPQLQEQHQEQLESLQKQVGRLEQQVTHNIMFVLRIVCPDVVEWPAQELQSEWEPFVCGPPPSSSQGNSHSHTTKTDETTVTVQVHFLLVNLLNRWIRQRVLIPTQRRKAVYMVVGSGTTAVELLLTHRETVTQVVHQLHEVGIGPKLGLVYAYPIDNDLVGMPPEPIPEKAEGPENEEGLLLEETMTTSSSSSDEDKKQPAIVPPSLLIPAQPSALPGQPASAPSSAVFVTELPRHTEMSVMDGEYVRISSSVLSMS